MAGWEELQAEESLSTGYMGKKIEFRGAHCKARHVGKNHLTFTFKRKSPELLQDRWLYENFLSILRSVEKNKQIKY